MVLRL